MGLEDRPRLLEVWPAVDALEQHDIDLAQELVDRSDDRHAELIVQLLGIAINAIAARWEIRAPSGISRDNPHAGDLGLGARGVQDFGKRDDMRGIQTDDAWRGRGFVPCVVLETSPEFANRSEEVNTSNSSTITMETRRQVTTETPDLHAENLIWTRDTPAHQTRNHRACAAGLQHISAQRSPRSPSREPSL